ncbi:hypothetical protein SNE40_003959 [Patella caerulea]|uniref:G-protein coupled receptors family 1 profile domain-containing protein n=1 Tax=Patella caerulea TaxID=87958 RepID=A0AAN8KAW3_PATCE
MVALWLPACIVDRVKNAADKLCIWEPSLNPEYVFVIALIGHHGACFVLLFCYLQVFFFMKKRAKIGPVGSKKMTASTSNGEMSVTATTQNCLSPTTKSNPTPSSTQKLQVPNTTDKSGNKHNIDDKNDLSEKRERKVFVTLSYILFGYVICWVPFHIVFDVSAINPDAVPQVVFTITFWMTYLNSAINPFLYNFSSPEFKNAFRKILLGK